MVTLTLTNPPAARRRPVLAAPATAGYRPARRPAAAPDAAALALLRRAQAGDREAFADIYRLHHEILRRYVTVRLRPFDRHAADDVVQDTFCAALAELHAAEADVRGWLLRLAGRMLAQHRWSARRYLRAALTVGEHQRRAPESTPTPVVVTAPGWRAVVQALADLHPNERLTLQLRVMEAQPRRAAAALMNCSVWTVSRRQRRALQHLADRLAAPLTPTTLARAYAAGTA